MSPAMAGDVSQITVLLSRWRAGDEQAPTELMNLVYVELRRLAASYMRRERHEHTLEPTALVHEAYLRLCGGASIDWQNRGHFFAVFAQQMRRVLVDHARSVRSAKRWGGLEKQPLGGADVGQAPLESVDMIALDEALERLAALDPRAARVVELRYFGGLTEREAAETLEISMATVKRDWDFARTWLLSRLQ
jgi:RNA polymerase sigma factor (TIGR02999 family)